MTKSKNINRKKRVWAEWEIEFIRSNMNLSDKQLGVCLSARLDQIRNARHKNGILRHKQTFVENGKKICTGCFKELPIDQFSKCKKFKNGVQSKCRNCQHEYYERRKDHCRERGKMYYKKNRTAVNKYKNEWAKTNGREVILKKERKLRQELSQCYVKAKLRRQGWSSGIIDATPGLVDIKRKILSEKRKIKNNEKEVQKTKKSK